MNGMNKHHNNQSGQVLLVIVLISAVLLTVGLSITQIGTTDTKVAKLEEENKQALAAAEAGLEVALQQGSANIESLLPKGSNITGSAIVEANPKSDFVSPLVKQDSLYTFYLTGYDNGVFDNDYYTNGLVIYFQDNPKGIARTAVELTLIRSDDSSERIILDANASGIPGAKKPTVGSNILPDYTDTTFDYFYQINQADINDIKLLLVRVLNNDSRVGLQSASSPCGSCSNTLPLQGKTVTSTAQTTSGVTKKIQLFQSYPQIPSDFFVTTF